MLSMYLVGAAALVLFAIFTLNPQLARFCYACFFKPIGKTGNQQMALEAFYQNQASIYDKTRTTLLKGRETLLRLLKAHLPKESNLVWVDLGGGTGYNIEYMSTIIPLSNFKAVYLVDLSPSLCNVARERFERMGVKNVFVHCRDINSFGLPTNEKADLVTMSYALSMVPNYHSAVDKVQSLLHNDGKFGIVDFYTQSESGFISKSNTVGGELSRHVNWLSRNFWRLWFEFDHVHLDPARRDYVEYSFGTVKSLNCRNRALGYIPYYVWIGCNKTNASDITYRHQLATESPFLAPEQASDAYEQTTIIRSKGYDATLVSLEQNMPYPSFYYQRELWRIFYDTQAPHHHQFNGQYIYTFTWEDPMEDTKILNFSKDDVVLAIASAGDNILHYAALANPPKRIHAVDLNPHQNHLLELKLASLRCLSYEDHWKLFGTGVHKNFKNLLVDKMSSHMSSPAFQYWESVGESAFSGHGIYNTGSTRWALRFARWVFKVSNLRPEVEKLCNARSIKTQVEIWTKHIKPALLNKYTRPMLCNAVFLWKALGVPSNQANLIETSLYQYIIDTLEPVIYKYTISTENYFYYLCLTGQYSQQNCPSYLSKPGHFNLSKRERALDGIRIHTDTINNVVECLRPESVTIAIVMDHMDWFSKTSTDAQDEVEQLAKCLCPGGRVMLRSSSKHPWYIGVFESQGFSCAPAAVRNSGTAIDRVNMYASTWVCTKAKMESITI